jgi:hypothetical protein
VELAEELEAASGAMVEELEAVLVEAMVMELEAVLAVVMAVALVALDRQDLPPAMGLQVAAVRTKLEKVIQPVGTVDEWVYYLRSTATVNLVSKRRSHQRDQGSQKSITGL